MPIPMGITSNNVCSKLALCSSSWFSRWISRSARFRSEISDGFAIVDIRRGAEPAYDFPLVIADRLGEGEEPAVDAIRPPKSILELEALVPVPGFGPGWLLPHSVLRVNRLHPAGPRRFLGRHAGIVEPAPVLVIAISVRPRRPDDLGDGLGEQSESPLGLRVLGAGRQVIGSQVVGTFSRDRLGMRAEAPGRRILTRTFGRRPFWIRGFVHDPAGTGKQLHIGKPIMGYRPSLLL